MANDRDYMQQLVFPLGKEDFQSASTEQYFILCCCEAGSLLSNPTKGLKMNFMDTTEEHDFCRPNTVDIVIKKIRCVGDVFFYCSPCTGGSSLQRLNLEVAKREGRHDTIVKIIDHWDLRWRLWESFETVVRHCKRVGATVLIQRPRFCSYWAEDKVSKCSCISHRCQVYGFR